MYYEVNVGSEVISDALVRLGGDCHSSGHVYFYNIVMFQKISSIEIQTTKVAKFDFEEHNNFLINLQVVDSAGLSTSAYIRVTIEDENDPPLLPSLHAFTVLETVDMGFTVGVITATDSDDSSEYGVASLKFQIALEFPHYLDTSSIVSSVNGTEGEKVENILLDDPNKIWTSTAAVPELVVDLRRLLEVQKLTFKWKGLHSAAGIIIQHSMDFQESDWANVPNTWEGSNFSCSEADREDQVTFTTNHIVSRLLRIRFLTCDAANNVKLSSSTLEVVPTVASLAV